MSTFNAEKNDEKIPQNFKIIQNSLRMKNDLNKSPKKISKIKKTIIQDVWANNLEEEIKKIMDLVEDYNVVAMARPKINYIKIKIILFKL